jgi:Tfp pilus assembly pilus retraction ATPase PilT
MAELDKIFKAAANAKASDVHLSPSEPYIIRQFGRLRKLEGQTFTPERC